MWGHDRTHLVAKSTNLLIGSFDFLLFHFQILFILSLLIDSLSLLETIAFCLDYFIVDVVIIAAAAAAVILVHDDDSLM